MRREPTKLGNGAKWDQVGPTDMAPLLWPSGKNTRYSFLQDIAMYVYLVPSLSALPTVPKYTTWKVIDEKNFRIKIRS